MSLDYMRYLEVDSSRLLLSLSFTFLTEDKMKIFFSLLFLSLAEELHDRYLTLVATRHKIYLLKK
jgi:hypothetical protein